MNEGSKFLFNLLFIVLLDLFVLNEVVCFDIIEFFLCLFDL